MRSFTFVLASLLASLLVTGMQPYAILPDAKRSGAAQSCCSIHGRWVDWHGSSRSFSLQVVLIAEFLSMICTSDLHLVIIFTHLELSTLVEKPSFGDSPFEDPLDSKWYLLLLFLFLPYSFRTMRAVARSYWRAKQAFGSWRRVAQKDQRTEKR